MKRKLLIGTLVAALAAGAYYFCSGINNSAQYRPAKPRVETINDRQYEVYPDKVIQLSEDLDKTAKFGVIADAHSCPNNVEKFVNEFKRQGLDGIVMLGDYATIRLALPTFRFDPYSSIVKCLDSAAKTGLPVYVIPGNHDLSIFYRRAIHSLHSKHNNVFDMRLIKYVDGDDFDMIVNPKINHNYHSLKNLLSRYSSDVSQLRKDDDPEILISHIPPSYKENTFAKYLTDGVNVGSKTLDEIMRSNQILFSLSGHIHGLAVKPLMLTVIMCHKTHFQMSCD
jgi:Icc-related predicted phosphoesterase